MKKHLLLLIVIAFVGLSVTSMKGQVDTITATLVDQVGCVGDTVLLPVVVENFEDVGAVQLRVSWDDSQLQYVGFSDADIVGLDVFTPMANIANVFWFDFGGNTVASLPDGDTLVNLSFVILSETSAVLPVDFDDGNCEIAFFDGVQSIAFPLVLVNGVIEIDERANISTDISPITCDGLGMISASTIAADVEFLWSGPDLVDSIPTISTEVGGAYTVVSISGNCTDTAIVEMYYDTIAPMIIELIGGAIECQDSSIVLEANLGNTGAFDYLWITPDQSTISTDMALLSVASAGEYILEVTNEANGCASIDSTLVTGGECITINIGDKLACVGDTVLIPLTVENFNDVGALQLDVIWDETQVNYVGFCDPINADVNVFNTVPEVARVFWFDVVQNVLLDIPNGDTLVVLKFEVLSLPNNAVVIELDAANSEIAFFDGGQSIPYALDLQGGMVALNQDLGLTLDAVAITCFQNTGELSASAANEHTTFSWQGADDSIADSTVVFPSIGGEYQVIAALGNCRDTASIELLYDTLATPITDINTSVLTCIDSISTIQIILGDTSVSNLDWVTPDGDELSTDTTILQVSLPGEYQLTLTNTNNGCVTTDTVVVESIVDLPEIAMSDTLVILNCATLEHTLTAESTLNSIIYEWQNTEGETLSAQDSLLVSDAGVYTLYATNTDNTCVTTTTVTVEENTAAAIFNMEGNIVLGCEDSTTVLTATSMLDDITYNWQSESGEVMAIADSLLVGEAQDIYLIGTNENSFCQDTIITTIIADTLTPSIALSTDTQTITCDVPMVIFSANDVDVDEVLSWQDADGLEISTNNMVNLSMSGSYQLLVTNTNNQCANTYAFEVAVDTLSPSFTLSDNDEITCENESLELTITTDTNNNCAWQNLADDCTITVTSEGTYTAIVTNPVNGCSYQESISVTDIRVIPQANLSLSNHLGCQDTLATISIDDAPINTIFQWTNSNGQQLSQNSNVEVNVADVYYCTIIDTLSQCIYEDQIEVTENTDLPTTNIQVPPTLTCTVNAVELIADATPNAVIHWEDAQNNPLPTTTVAAPGIYYAYITDTTTMCIGIDSVEVVQNIILPQPPVFTPDNGEITCTNPTIIATLTPEANVQYEWQQLDGTVVATGTNHTFQMAENLQIIATHNESSCTASATITITENTTPPIITFNNPLPFDCATGETIINSLFNPNYTYQWTSSNPTNIESPTENETIIFEAAAYDLEVTDTQNGCTNTAQITVADLDNGPQTAAITIEQPSCLTATPLGSILVTSVQGGTPDYQYNLYDESPSSTAFFPDLPISEYPLTITDANGCTWDTLLTIAEILVPEAIITPTAQLITLGEETTLTLQTNIDIQNIEHIQWSTNTGEILCADCELTIQHWPLETTTYYANITTIHGCQAYAETTIIVQQGEAVYIPNAFSPNNDGINDFWTIYAKPNLAQVEALRIYDRWGELLFENTDFLPTQNNGWDGYFNGDPMPVGVYIYELSLRYINNNVEHLKGDLMIVK